MPATAGIDVALAIVARAGALGARRLPNGTELIGHVPHVAPEAWLHIVFAPLRAAQLIEVQRRVGREVPLEFGDFLKRMNGLSLFSDALSIYGLRTSFRRSGDAVWQPFSIETPNRLERPRDAAHALVFVGGYRWDGTLLYIDLRDSRVYRCTRESAGPLNSWNSFSHMIGAEAERLSALFDATGRPTDPNVSTAPMPDKPLPPAAASAGRPFPFALSPFSRALRLRRPRTRGNAGEAPAAAANADVRRVAYRRLTSAMSACRLPSPSSKWVIHSS